MTQLRETIVFDSGNFYRLERWSGDERLVKIIKAPTEIDRIPAFGARWHYHRAMELTFVLRGTSTCFVANRLQKFSAGELFVLGENIPHYWHHPRGSEGLSILLEFPAEHGIWEFSEVKSLRLLAERALCGLGIVGAAGKRFCRSIEELSDMTGLQRLGGLFQLLHGVLHAEPRDVRLVTARPFDLTGINEQEEAIRRALSYIHANYREQINLPDLLDLTGMSRTTFTRLFLRYAGACFSTRLNEVRLQAVCRELRNSTKAVSSIALDHGFTQLSFFNRLFRRELGICPSVYREQHLIAARPTGT
jgi:AraC-like DNA-binding protein